MNYSIINKLTLIVFEFIPKHILQIYIILLYTLFIVLNSE